MIFAANREVFPGHSGHAFPALLDALPAAIYTTDAEGRIIYYNEAAVELWGCRPEVGTDRWCGSWKLFRSDGSPLPHDQCPMAIALKENRPIRGAEAIAERPDGTRVTFVPFPTPIQDEEGELLGAVNLLIDVTRDKEMHALQESAQSFRMLFKNNPVPMWVYATDDLRFLAVNKAAILHYGYTREQFLSMTILEVAPEDTHDRTRAAVRAERGEAHGEVVWTHRKADGNLIDVEIHSHGLEFHGRSAAIVASLDVTARRRAVAQLHGTRRFLHTIIENIPAMIFVKEVNDHRFVFLNHAGEQLLGMPRDLVVGKTDRDLFPAEQADSFIRRDREVLSTRGSSVVEEPISLEGGRQRTLRTQKIAICDETNTPQFLLGISEDISEAAIAAAKIAHMAHHDQLTSLPNRSTFYRNVEEAIDSRKPVSVLLIDLDGFKAINDVLGHHAGDLLLVEIGTRLAAHTPDGATVARLGGDEFAILLPYTADPLRCCRLAEDICRAIVSPFQAGGREFNVSASIGVALSPPHGATASELLAAADLALYRVKADGGHSVRLFEPTMRNQLLARERLESELRAAVENGELELFYQPQIRLCDKRLVGAEALLRWNHPQRGLLGPAAFISVLEASVLAESVGNWTIKEACRTLSKWRQQGQMDLRVGINLFTAQLRGRNLVAVVEDNLSRYELPPELIELEITENIALGFDDAILQPLDELRARGVGLAFDDFGTGFASLSALKRFPLTRLKIDRTFVDNVVVNRHDSAIVSSVLSLADGIGLKVVAEGIETPEQLNFLAARGCEEGQGFLFSHPLREQEFTHLFGRQSWCSASR